MAGPVSPSVVHDSLHPVRFVDGMRPTVREHCRDGNYILLSTWRAEGRAEQRCKIMPPAFFELPAARAQFATRASCARSSRPDVFADVNGIPAR